MSVELRTRIEPEPELNLLRGLDGNFAVELDRRRWPVILAASMALHLALFLFSTRLSEFTLRQASPEPPRPHVILYLPRDLLTQRAPNRREVSKNIDLQSLLSQPDRPSNLRQKSSEASRKQTASSPPSPPPAPSTPPAKSTEHPQTALAKPSVAPPIAAPRLPQPNAASKQGPFQNLDDTPAPANPALKPPSSDLDAAARDLAQRRAGQLAAQEPAPENDAAPLRPGMLNPGAAPHAAVELQSDPQGADFKQYLTQILAIVRANWRRVIPQSARQGNLRGRTVVEFAINRDGSIPKLVIATPSGSDELDRAAGAGLSMSNPLPPLPADYRGMQVRLAFTFTYNFVSQ